MVDIGSLLQFGLLGAFLGFLAAALVWLQKYLAAERGQRVDRRDAIAFVIAGTTAGLLVGLLFQRPLFSAAAGAASKQAADQLASLMVVLGNTWRGVGT